MSLKIVLLHFSKSRRMFRVNKRILLFIAGCVWIIAGVNILRIGILTWMHDAHYSVLKVGEAVIVFLLFLNFVFLRLFRKHSRRIAQKGEKNCPFSFFDAKGWIVMIFIRFLYRFVICTDYNRSIISYSREKTAIKKIVLFQINKNL